MEATAAFSPGEQSSYNQHTKNIWCNYPIFVLLPLTVCRLWFASIWKWWWSFKCNSFTMTVSSHHPEDVMRQRINKWSSLYKFCFLKLFFFAVVERDSLILESLKFHVWYCRFADFFRGILKLILLLLFSGATLSSAWFALTCFNSVTHLPITRGTYCTMRSNEHHYGFHLNLPSFH